MAIEVDGKIYRNLPEQVEENANQIEDLKTLFSTLGTVMVYKGSVATYADLPTENQKVGDVYNVIDTGNNYAWDGEDWDEIGSSVDLSNLVTLDTNQTITGTKTFANGIGFDYENATGKWGIKQDGGNQLSIYQDNTQTFCFQGGQFFSLTNVDLGNNNRKWKDLYLSGSAHTTNVNSDASSLTLIGSGHVNINGYYSLRPSQDNSIDLGTSSLHWKDLYLSGKAYIGSQYIYDAGNNILRFNINGSDRIEITQNTIRPVVSENLHLGSKNYKIGDIYLGNQLKDGNNTNYGLTLPDTTSWTANKTIATTDQIGGVLLYKHQITGITSAPGDLFIISTTPALTGTPTIAQIITLLKGAIRSYYGWNAEMWQYDIITNATSSPTNINTFYVKTSGTPPQPVIDNFALTDTAIGSITYSCTQLTNS